MGMVARMGPCSLLCGWEELPWLLESCPGLSELRRSATTDPAGVLIMSPEALYLKKERKLAVSRLN